MGCASSSANTNHNNNNQNQYGNTNASFQQENMQDNTEDMEDLFFMYQRTHVQEGVNQCQNSIGKILAEMQIPKQVLNSTLMGIRCSPMGFKITELGNNLYQFSMEKVADVNRIIKGEPWTIRNVWLKVYAWNKTTNIQDLDFKHIPLAPMSSNLGSTSTLQNCHNGESTGITAWRIYGCCCLCLP